LTCTTHLPSASGDPVQVDVRAYMAVPFKSIDHVPESRPAGQGAIPDSWEGCGRTAFDDGRPASSPRRRQPGDTDESVSLPARRRALANWGEMLAGAPTQELALPIGTRLHAQTRQ
jgi:hypothetical protein